MNEREVECSRCDNTTIMIQEDIPSGWVFVETGWAAVETGWSSVNTIKLCPNCKERFLKHRLILGECSRKYPNLIMHPDE